jgi:hypothetical protein
MIATSRRGTLSLSLSTVASVLLTAPVSANPDGQILEACGVLMGLEHDIEALSAQRQTLEDEGRTDPQLRALYAKQRVIEDHLSDLPAPTTIAGAAALAQLMTARWPVVDEDGTLLVHDFEEWASATLFEFVAGLKT